jgi:transcriptional regulator with XRE-family HTH domain
MARRQAAELVRRVGRELRIARVTLGLSQVELARRVGIPQSSISEIERGALAANLARHSRLAAAVGMQLSVRLYPNGQIGLRDSGQLSIAQLLIAQAHAAWRPILEHPIGQAPDLRAADLVLISSVEVIHVEIERNLGDFQAQLRGGTLKRNDLATRYAQPVRFVLVLPDTARLRRIVQAYAPAITAAMPRNSREVLTALRSGEPLGADGLLWVRERRSPASNRASR